ncbi:flagellar filament capping protein FliD [Comamonas sp. w2-DMI]|uniref:flagellar filament capping protein FliD n=1 Tax=Comamonas sp. w2-DMI TaxID=3126391 RepID=UPI0032E4C3A3
MAGTISSAGIGAGIDGNSIISQLTALQRSQPLQRLKDAASSLDTQISTVGTLKSLMSTLQDAARKVTDKGAWQLATATSSNTAVAVKVTGAALPSSSTIEVSQLARAQTLASAQFSVASGAAAAKFGVAGKLVLTSSSDSSKIAAIEITADMTLTQVAEAINKQSSVTGVTASVIKDANGERLSMNAKNSGAANGFTVIGDSVHPTSPEVLTALGLDASGDPRVSAPPAATDAVLQQGLNAKAKVNGIDVESATNEFKQTLPGLSFTVSQVTQAGAPALVTVAADTDGMKKNLQAFIDAYNALNAKLADVTKYDAESKTRGVMQGDSSIVSITSELRATLSSNLGGINLSDLGIQMGKGGAAVVRHLCDGQGQTGSCVARP